MAFGDDTVLQNRERLSETVKCILPSWRELASEEFEETSIQRFGIYQPRPRLAPGGVRPSP